MLYQYQWKPWAHAEKWWASPVLMVTTQKMARPPALLRAGLTELTVKCTNIVGHDDFHLMPRIRQSQSTETTT